MVNYLIILGVAAIVLAPIKAYIWYYKFREDYKFMSIKEFKKKYPTLHQIFTDEA